MRRGWLPFGGNRDHLGGWGDYFTIRTPSTYITAMPLPQDLTGISGPPKGNSRSAMEQHRYRGCFLAGISMVPGQNSVTGRSFTVILPSVAAGKIWAH